MTAWIEPYNKPTKAKVTLAFVGLSHKLKSGWAMGWAGWQLSLQTIENRVDRLTRGAYIRTVKTDNRARLRLR